MEIMTYERFLSSKKKTIELNDAEFDRNVLDIIHEVRQNGDEAIFQFTKKFDGISLDRLLVSEEEFVEAESLVDDQFREVLEVARNNITNFHEAQKEHSWYFNKQGGVMLGQQVTAIDRVGIYIPGGKAAYPSTVLMNVIPAQIAGVKEVFLTSPPQQNGKISAHVLVAANFLGIKHVYKMGGTQAIAAYAYGTETVKKVDKIVGPGNAYVARAKKWVFGDVAIDMIAGPSEICVVADETAPVEFVAADLLSQAEHDEDAVPIFVTTSDEIAKSVAIEVEKQLAALPRKNIAAKSVANNGKIFVAESLEEVFIIVNDIAPEHLQLMIKNASEHLSNIRHAGAIFIGNYSPEALGDYVAGPNHTLPTSGTAKFSSPLGVYDFIKKSSVIRYDEKALERVSKDIMTLANAEGLTAHADAIKKRKEE